MEQSPQTHSPADDGSALRAIARMRTRVRLLRAGRGAIEMSLYGAAFAIVVLLCAKTGRLPDPLARRLLLAASIFPLVGVVAGLARRVPALMAAQLLDRAYGLKDRLANALEFGALPAASRTPMMEAALLDAAEHARGRDLRPARALAWHWPAETGYVLGLCALLAGVGLLEFRTAVAVTRRAPAANAGPRDAIQVDADTVAAMREFATQGAQNAHTEEERRAMERFNQFVDQVANGQLDRQDAFRRLQALQQELEASRENDREALREALRQVGNQLNSADAARQLAESLQNGDTQHAAEQMHQLAEQLRQNHMTERQRQDLERALQRAQQQQDNEDAQRQMQQAREEVERLLQQQRERQLSQDEQRNLRQRQRELEQMQRNQERRDQQRRQLSRLNRSMSQAAQDLNHGQQQQAAQDLDEGAQDLNRMHNEQMSEQQMSELRQQLEDMRQRMRQQNGQGGQEQRARMQRFAGQARGGSMPGGQEPGGQQGRQLQSLRRGSGGGQGMPAGEGQGQGQGQQPGQGQGQQGEGDQPGGVQAGTQHDENIRGAATAAQGRMRTVNVQGQQTGNGPSRSQVIRSAAQEGFTSQGYRDVHAAYWDHAREVIHAGEVPPGYRSYVRQYFQLIRPRDGE